VGCRLEGMMSDVLIILPFDPKTVTVMWNRAKFLGQGRARDTYRGTKW
jgi:hypothetical protein